KTDIRAAQDVAESYPGVGYSAFDLLQIPADRIQHMLRRLRVLFDEGVLSPLPARTWDAQSIHEAFRYLQQGKNVGKLVLTMPAVINPNGTVLATGGTGPLGGLIARRLVTHHNLTHLLLTSRQGADAPGASRLHTDLTELGATVTIAACDVSDRAALA